jgi:hypothetical protein
MITETHPSAVPTHGRPELGALRRGVSKIVRLGQRVGVSPIQMIQLLESGMTVAELLAYLAARCRNNG